MRILALATLLLAACDTHSVSRATVLPPTGTGPGTDNGDLAVYQFGNGDAGGGNPNDCTDASQLVYVIDASGKLSSFSPDKLLFADLGTVHCGNEPEGSVNSMAVDRSVVGWVNFQSGNIYKVAITDPNLTCTPTAFQPGLGLGFTTFGMGYSTNAVSGSDETLFIAGPDNSLDNYLATLDTTTLSPKSVGSVPSWPELTGTGDALLYGFFPAATGTKIAELDKLTAKLGTSYDLSQLNGTQMAWAFAFWGGDFWIFLERDSDNSTNVWRLHLFDGGSTVSEAIHDTGREIVGAGVSTCAPTTIS